MEVSTEDFNVLQKRAEQAEAELTNLRIERRLEKAAEEAGYRAPEFSIPLARKAVRWDDTLKTVVGIDGRSVEKIVREAIIGREYLLKPQDESAEAAKAGQASQEPDLKRLFGPGSDARLANQVALRDKALYRHLREQAKEQGLIG